MCVCDFFSANYFFFPLVNSKNRTIDQEKRMTVERQASSGSFFQLVLLPKIRIGLILLGVLAIGFGSWLETNTSVSSCSFKSSLAMHQVFLYRNISSNLTTPDSVTFGLWRHCYIYALNCSCSPIDMKYQPGKIHNIIMICFYY